MAALTSVDAVVISTLLPVGPAGPRDKCAMTKAIPKQVSRAAVRTLGGAAFARLTARSIPIGGLARVNERWL